MSRPALRHRLRLLGATLPIAAILLLPHDPSRLAPAALARVPLELPALLLVLVCGGRVPGVRPAAAIVLWLLAVQKAADLAMQSALMRPFNPLGDLALIDAMTRLLAGAIGPARTAAALLAAAVALAALAALAWWATGVWARTPPAWRLRHALPSAAVLACGLVIADAGAGRGTWSLPLDPPGRTDSTQLALDRGAMAARTLAGFGDFTRTVAADPFAGADGLLNAIDRDVLVVFIESYGRTSLDTPLYAGTHAATLRQAADRLAGLGLATRSGILEAPTRGGQSWLSHEAFAGGLWTNDQGRYLAALASGRETLYHIAARSGFRTATVMPAIQMDWPEADTMGFQTVLTAADLGYAGPHFNWVTMPDQYTLAALDRILRDTTDPQPLFAQVALISSHAPWTPVPHLLPWEAIDDGHVFAEMAAAGDPPAIVWRDRDRVREQYRLAVDYALRTVFDYAARHSEEPPLMFVIGDHQTAGWIALDDRPDVPIHVIGPPGLVARVAPWGWSRGLVPAADDPVIRMDRMRGMILRAFSDGPDRVAER